MLVYQRVIIWPNTLAACFEYPQWYLYLLHQAVFCCPRNPLTVFNLDKLIRNGQDRDCPWSNIELNLERHLTSFCLRQNSFLPRYASLAWQATKLLSWLKWDGKMWWAPLRKLWPWEFRQFPGQMPPISIPLKYQKVFSFFSWQVNFASLWASCGLSGELGLAFM